MLEISGKDPEATILTTLSEVKENILVMNI